MLFARLGADQLERDVEGAARIQRMGRDVHAAGLDLGDVQQVVDQREQMGAGGMDVAGIVAIAFRADRPETFLGDDFGKAQNGVQRRAQLMAHIGQEGGLGGIGGFRLEALLQRLVAGLFQLARQVLDLEAQAGVLAHAQHQRTAVNHICSAKKGATRPSACRRGIAQQEARRVISESGNRLATYIFMLLPRADHQAGDHRHQQAARNMWFSGLPGSQHSQGIRPQAGAAEAWIASQSIAARNSPPRCPTYYW